MKILVSGIRGVAIGAQLFKYMKFTFCKGNKGRSLCIIIILNPTIVVRECALENAPNSLTF